MSKLVAIKAKIEALDGTDYRGAEFTVQGREIKSILGGIVSYLEELATGEIVRYARPSDEPQHSPFIQRRIPADDVSQGVNASGE